MMKITTAFLIFSLVLLTFLNPGDCHSQPVSKEDPPVKLGEIAFKVREVDSTSSPLKILELHIEVLNPGRRTTVPANTVKVVLSKVEVIYAGPRPAEEFIPAPEEAFLTAPLSPLTGRVLIIGFPLPKEKIESITFEIHLNPPEGEKKQLSINL